MGDDRDLDLEGCFNTRDLGGLRTRDGGVTRRGSLIRSDDLDHLTPKGWAQLEAAGVRTVVDLRNDDELPSEATAPDAVRRVHVPLDDIADTAFWTHVRENELDGTPLYYGPFLAQKAERIAAVVAAIADAPPGGVLFHCGLGRDRTGLVAAVLLALAGVEDGDIATDYEISNFKLAPKYARHGVPDQAPEIEDILRRKNTTSVYVLTEVLSSLDVESYLLDAGVSERDLESVKERLRGWNEGPT